MARVQQKERERDMAAGGGGAPPQGRAAVESSQLPRGIEIVVRLGGVVPLPRRLRGPPPGVEDQRRLL